MKILELGVNFMILFFVASIVIDNTSSENFTTRMCSIKTRRDVFYKMDNLLGDKRGYGEVSSADECSGHCMDNANCKGSTYYSKRKICTLHGSTMSAKQEGAGDQRPDIFHTSFYCSETKKYLSCQITKYDSTQYSNFVLAPTITDQVSLEDCIQQCLKSQLRCKSVTYHNMQKLCTRHSGSIAQHDGTHYDEDYIHVAVNCVTKSRLFFCDIVKYGTIAYKTDRLYGGHAKTFEDCVEMCLLFYMPCYGINFIESEEFCGMFGSAVSTVETAVGKYVSSLETIHASIKCPIEQSGPVGCGIQHPDHLPHHLPEIDKHRIINGLEAKPHSWPWQICLTLVRGLLKMRCGGSLLRVNDNVEKSDIILTAGHCIKEKTKTGNWSEYKPSEVFAVAGDHNIKVFELGEQRGTVAKVVPYPSYGSYHETIDDLAIILLNKPFLFTKTVRPICLPKPGDPIPVGKLCVATGWGRNVSASDPTIADELQQLVAPAHKSSKCDPYFRTYLEHKMICAGGLDKMSGVCQGDSGGPFQCQEPDKSWTLYGLTNFGNDDCIRKPSVFTRISNKEYMAWIIDSIRQLSRV